MSCDTVSDMLIRIKNGYLAKKTKISAVYSKLNEKLGQLLVREGFIKKVSREKNNLNIDLLYKNGKAGLENVKRISKPSLRTYVNKKRLPKVLGGAGLAIISTSKGLLTEKEAKKQNIGGEVICYIW